MLYDSYHEKISKIVVSLRKIFKHIVLISIVSVLIITAIIAFMATKGIVLDDKSAPENFEMTYGETIPLESKALFAKVVYEYSEDGNEWSIEEPNMPGEYMVRAKAKAIFGNPRYGKVYTFKLEPKNVDVSVTDNQIIYGNMPSVSAELVFEDTITCDSYTYGDRLAQYTKVTPVIDSVKILNADGEDVTKLYKINAVTTDITVMPRAITVTVSDKEMIYNDTKLSYDGYELSNGDLAPGDVLQAVFDKWLIDVGEVENTPELRVVTDDGLDISVHYDISTEIGTLEVDYRPLIIETGSSEKVYDDKELSNTEYKIVGEYGVVEGHIVECLSNSSIIDVDEVENVLTLEIKNANGEDKTPNYSLFYERGTLKITPRPVNISSGSGTWEYDGEEHYTDISMDGFCTGHTVKASWPSIIDAGTMENTVTIKSVLNPDGRDVLSNYELIFDNIGTLTVTKRPITITHESSTSGNTYNGLKKSFSNYAITSGSLAKNDTLNITFPSFSQAGRYEDQNKIVSAIVSSDRTDGVTSFEATENYDIKEVFGTVVIDKCKLTIQANDNKKQYDGLSFTAVDYSIIEGILPEGHELTVVYKHSGADVGRYDADIDLEQTKITYNGEDATSNFDMTVNSDKLLVITPRSITIQAIDTQKPYDGNMITSSEYSVTSGELVQGHTITKIEFVTSLVNRVEDENVISRYTNKINKDSIVITDSNNADVTGNYEITCLDGTLDIVLRKLSVTSNSESKVYDRTALKGKEVTVDPISEGNDGLLDGHKLKYTLRAEVTTVAQGKVTNKISNLDIVDSNGKSVKEFYAITQNEGVLEILPIEINVSTASDEKIYDGTALVRDECTSDHKQKLLSGDTVKIKVIGTLTNAGTVDNTVEISIFSNGSDITNDGNYKINYNYGTLNVKPRPIKILPIPDITEKLYDGKPLECINYSDKSDYVNQSANEGLLNGHKLEELHFLSLTDAGEIPIQIDTEQPLKILNGREDVSSNYTIVIDGDYTLKVNKRNIIIESSSAKKEYDGRPLTAPECVWTSDSEHTLLEGHKIELTASGSQTEEGKSSNVITEVAKILDTNGNDLAKNYEIEYREGTLEVYKTVVAKVVASKDGYVYLKAKSYGDYDGKFFGAAPSATRSFYYSNVRNCSFSLLTSAALNENYYETNYLSVTESIKYLLPYYTVISGYDCVLPKYSSEDYTTLSSSSSYTTEYFDYSYEIEGTADLTTYYPDSYSSYARWVSNNYMSVPTDTQNALLEIVAANGFDNMDIETRIKEIAVYMRTAAAYNPNYDISLDSENDIAVAFLRDYREGSAKHYAITATMLYRSLGIPARFVEGYIVNTVADEQVDVKDIHYWVEVFVEGYGWMQVEVTTGMGGMADDKIDITVKPKDAQKIYDGTSLVATEAELVTLTEEIVQLFADGKYKISATFEGSQLRVGESPSNIQSIKILDEKGNDVTYKFNIQIKTGLLTVTPIPINVFLYNNSKTYDGKPLVYSGSKFYSIRDEAFKNSGYTLELSVTFTDVTVHSLTAKDITDNSKEYVTFSVMDGENDLTEFYCINFVYYSDDVEPKDYIVAQIKPRTIEITAASQTKYYTAGAKLTNGTVTVTKGSLANGHRLIAVANGVLEEVGSIENAVNPEAVFVLDADGNDVTNNYKISIISGTLTFIEQV